MILRKGDKGEDVRRLQTALKEHGFDIGIDGDFGNRTRSAVREFQAQNGLGVDGVAGPKTLAALGLDLDGTTENGVTNIEFERDETVVPTEVKARIDAYVGKMEDQHEALLDVTRDALSNFETTMSFASTTSANPDALGSLLQQAFNLAVDQLVSSAGKLMPGLSVAVTIWQTIGTELARAGTVSANANIGNWIKDQRVAIDNARRHWNRVVVQEEVSLEFLESDDRQQFLDDLFRAHEQLKQRLVPRVSVLELRLYEAWINAHFRAIGVDAQGCIEIRWEFEDNAFDFVSCTVEAPGAKKIQGALNRLLDEDLVPEFKTPLHLNVRKRACFFVENHVGGHSWSCGWLDAQNEIFHMPIHDESQRAIRDLGWRVATHRFKND